MSEIIEAIKLRGADTHVKIQEETLASTGCGGCEGDVLRILEEVLKNAAEKTP